ncbi:melatonin receptor type 1C-like [Clytia hemisphaerica]|uniref:melatonin receptor type 1C-like n=1 Tax=Clytia hemisphaerica TaxID=252671 RepID=UPI0034D3C1A1|eukprot:TCONS_00050631-protein
MLDALRNCREGANLVNFSSLHGMVYDYVIGAVLVFIMISNTLVLFGLYRTNQLDRFTNRLFFVMSINDLIGGAGAIIVFFVNVNIPNENECKILGLIEGSVFIFFATASGVNTTILAFDRLVYIRHTLKYSRLFSTKRSVIFTLIAVYGFSTLWTLLEFFCNRIFLLVAGTLEVVHLTIFAVINIQLLRYIRKQGHLIRRLSKNFIRTTLYQTRATKTVLLVTFVCLLTNLPICAYAIYMYVSHTWYPNTTNWTYLVYIFYWSLLIQLSNSGLNALIFISRNKALVTLYSIKRQETSVNGE